MSRVHQPVISQPPSPGSLLGTNVDDEIDKESAFSHNQDAPEFTTMLVFLELPEFDQQSRIQSATVNSQLDR